LASPSTSPCLIRYGACSTARPWHHSEPTQVLPPTGSGDLAWVTEAGGHPSSARLRMVKTMGM
jgi:hypothetical protein